MPYSAVADTNDSLGLRVRAAFLYNFARYTQWPENDKANVFRFCLAQSPQMLPVLQKAVTDKKIDGLSIEVHITSPEESLENCQLLYFGADWEHDDWHQSLNSQAATLIVGEGQDMAQRGGMIGFYMLEGRLRFAINPDQVEQAKLQMSSHLLGLATIVGTPQP